MNGQRTAKSEEGKLVHAAFASLPSFEFVSVRIRNYPPMNAV